METIKKKILIIEDNKLIRDEIVDIMRMENYQTIEAKDGEEGLTKAKKYLPDMIISDVLMPKVDGIGLIKELKKTQLTEDIPFVFMSALTDNEYVRKGISLGADDYIPKPVNIDDLMKSIKMQLRKKNKVENKMNNLKNNIIHSLPHELRTPLNSILGLSYLMMTQREEYSNQKIIEFSNYINKSGKRLLRTINQYLLFTDLILLQSDIEKIKLIKTKTTKNIEQKIVLIVKDLKSNCQYFKKISINVSNQEVKITPEHFEIIINELVSNSIKFSKKEGVININSEMEQDKLKLTIENIGNGIKQEQINDIGTFMQFNRKKQEQQGIGFGLSIVTLISEIYDLDLNIETEEEKYFRVSVKFDLQS